MGDAAPHSTPRLGPLALVLGLAAIGIWILWNFLPALAWAAVVAIALWPLFEQIRRRSRNRTIAATVMTLLVGLGVIVPLVILRVELGRTAVAAAQWLRMAEREGAPAPDWLLQMPLIGSYLTDWWRSNLSEPGAAAEAL